MGSRAFGGKFRRPNVINFVNIGVGNAAITRAIHRARLRIALRRRPKNAAAESPKQKAIYNHARVILPEMTTNAAASAVRFLFCRHQQSTQGLNADIRQEKVGKIGAKTQFAMTCVRFKKLPRGENARYRHRHCFRATGAFPLRFLRHKYAGARMQVRLRRLALLLGLEHSGGFDKTVVIADCCAHCRNFPGAFVVCNGEIPSGSFAA